MKADWLNIGSRGPEDQTAVERLSNAPFDELVEIDLINDRCKNIYHVEGKYFVPFLSGSWSSLFQYCIDHMVHPEDREIYSALMDPDTMHERLGSAELDGVQSAELRYRTVDGKWLWVRQVLAFGARNGLPEGIIYCYLFDINVQKQREQGSADGDADAPSASRRDELTGLLMDREFFAQAQRRLPTLELGQWCVMAVDIENFKLFCDWHGQQVGNVLLTEIGEILRDVEQDTGGLAGYRGQDDFVLLMPYDIQRINDLFEQLHRLIVSKGDYVGFQPIFGICMVQSASEQITELIKFEYVASRCEQELDGVGYGVLFAFVFAFAFKSREYFDTVIPVVAHRVCKCQRFVEGMTVEQCFADTVAVDGIESLPCSCKREVLGLECQLPYHAVVHRSVVAEHYV